MQVWDLGPIFLGILGPSMSEERMTSSQRNVRLRAKSPCGVQSLRVGLLVAAVRVFVIEERNFFQAAFVLMMLLSHLSQFIRFLHILQFDDTTYYAILGAHVTSHRPRSPSRSLRLRDLGLLASMGDCRRPHFEHPNFSADMSEL